MVTTAERPVLDLDVMRKATANWVANRDERERKTAAAAAGEFTQADDKARLAAHANRLLKQVRARAPANPDALPPVVRKEIARGGVTAATINDKLFEAIIGETRDFLAIGFLEAAAATLQLGFDTETGTTTREFRLLRDRLFLTNPDLDCSLTAVEGDLTP